MARTEWLSEGAEKLAFEPADGEGFHCDIAIVGSGYGGAVAAARLAGRQEAKDGRASRVWVLERGHEFVPGTFPERFADLIGEARVTWGAAPRVSGRPEGLFDLRLGGDVSALMGNGLGGGSLINAGVLARPLADVFRRAPWPREISLETLQPHFAEAERMLGGGPLPHDPPAKLQALRALGHAIDGRYDGRLAHIAVNFDGKDSTADVNQRKCVACGDCFTGCNHGAKNTLPTNYLALAKRRGARLFTGITVLSIEGRDEDWRLHFRFTDHQIARRFGEVPPPLRVRRVILAAGSFGSTGILMRSHEKGLGLSRRRLGERFSTNGDAIFAVYGMPTRIDSSSREDTPPSARNVGPTISGIIDLRDRRVPLAIEELAIPAALRRPFEEVVTSLAVVHGLARGDTSRHRTAGTGADPAAVDPELISRTAVYATMGDDGAGGRLDFARHDVAQEHLRLDDDVRVQWHGVGEHEVFHQAMRVLEKAHAGTGASVMANPMWRALPSSIARVLDGGELGGSVLTVHPLGGCAMAKDGSEGVVNCIGQVFLGEASEEVYKTLAVLDGAIVPTALGINPCLTIAALAEHAVCDLRGCWGLSEVQAPAGAVVVQPLPPEDLPWPPSQPTGVRLAERLTGELLISVEDGSDAPRRFGAEIVLEYCDVDDLEAFLRRRGKRMPVAAARLRLSSTSLQWHDTVDLKGDLWPFEREPSGRWRRIARAGFAWLWNRGASELLRAVFRAPAAVWRALLRRLLGEPRVTAGPGLWRYVCDWLALASQAGEARWMTYRLAVTRDVTLGPGGPRVLAAGDELVARKRIAYVPALQFLGSPWPSPWDQLTQLPVALRRHAGWLAFGIGTLEVDLPYFVKQFATQLQITRQENQPRAIADLFSFAAYLVRLIGKIHIWSFRAPDYPNPYPEYEFDDASRGKARDAAVAAKRKPVSRLRHRLPGKVSGLKRTSTRFPVPPSPGEIRLTRYEKPTQPRTRGQPVLLIHGLGASGNTFTAPTLREGLVKHLAEAGFDPWVLDLRTSVSLACSKCDWNFDDVALHDIPVALRWVADDTGKKVDVVAHCIGAAMFSMAALEGALKDRNGKEDLVRRAVLSQAGPLMELPPANRFRGYLASYFKYYLQVDEFDTTASLTTFNRFLDRVLAAYPYPRHEWGAHMSLAPVTHEPYCLRTYGIYGRLFEHANLDPATLERLGDYIGHVRYQTYQQTIFYATMGRLTDRFGKNRYVTPDKIAMNLAFPLCLLHGARNSVFDVASSRRSFELLASIFSRGPQLRLVEIRNYGHQDCMIGRNAASDVFPKIVDFLRAQVGAGPPTQAARAFVLRPPRLGPILGWLRREAEGCVARMIIVPNDARSPALYALSFVVRGGQPEEGSGTFHDLRPPPRSGPPVRMIDVALPDADDAVVVVLTVHNEFYEQEFAPRPGVPAREHPFSDDLDNVLGPDVGLPLTAAEAVGRRPDHGLLERALAGCRDFAPDGQLLTAGRRVSDDGYARAVSAAVLDARVLDAADKADEADEQASRRGDRRLCFALASCRYAANVMDRELADRNFGTLRDRLEHPDRSRPVPQFLFLAGDTIYADATYGIFDPTLEEERYDQRYYEAWTAPNAREVLRRLPVYPMLDDHEVEENFEGPQPEGLGRAGIRAFEAFHMMLTRHAPVFPEDRYWYDLRAGGFDFFVADTRTGRRRERGRGSRRASIGDDMLADMIRWLGDAHRRGPDLPKFIVSPSVVAPWSRDTRGDPAYALRSDAWDGFPYSLHELLGTIAGDGIRNVVFLSGDYHCSVYCRMTLRRNGNTVPAYSIVSSGLYSPYPFANTRARDLEDQFCGTLRDRMQATEVPRYRALGDLEICYEAREMASCGSFAVVDVAQRGDESWMTVAFEEGAAPVEERLS